MPVLSRPEGEPLGEREAIRAAARVVGFTAAGVCFVGSQLSLLWVLATGGVGATPSAAVTAWIVSSLGLAFFLFLAANTYRPDFDRSMTSLWATFGRHKTPARPEP